MDEMRVVRQKLMLIDVSDILIVGGIPGRSVTTIGSKSVTRNNLRG